MNAKEKNTFYLLWTLAIIVCTLLAVVVLLYTSFAKPQDKAPQPTEPVSYSDQLY